MEKRGLKEEADIMDFLQTVHKCRGDVLFETDDGDSLNLKSLLSEYLFSMMASNRSYMVSGQVVCRVEEDYGLLEKFIAKS